jgi:hypothetical protein
MEFYSADIEMLMSGWNTLYFDENTLGSLEEKIFPDAIHPRSQIWPVSIVAQCIRYGCRKDLSII